MNAILRLRGESIDGGNVCCLGSQLAQIIDSMEQYLGAVNWYVADVDLIGPSALPQGPTPQIVGSSDKLVELVSNIDQFLRGVFLAVRVENVDPHFRELIDTEDPVEVDLRDAIVEMRAFDTTFFEILTRDRKLAGVLADAFHVSPVSA